MKAFKNYFLATPPASLDRPGSSNAGQSKPHTTPAVKASSSGQPAWTSSSLSWGPSVPNAPGRTSIASNAPSAPSTHGLNSTPAWFTASASELSDLRADLMVQNIWQDQLRRVYASGNGTGEGVVLKKAKGDYICAPAALRTDSKVFYDAICQLNVSVSCGYPSWMGH